MIARPGSRTGSRPGPSARKAGAATRLAGVAPAPSRRPRLRRLPPRRRACLHSTAGRAPRSGASGLLSRRTSAAARPARAALRSCQRRRHRPHPHKRSQQQQQQQQPLLRRRLQPLSPSSQLLLGPRLGGLRRYRPHPQERSQQQQRPLLLRRLEPLSPSSQLLLELRLGGLCRRMWIWSLIATPASRIGRWLGPIPRRFGAALSF